MIAAWTYWGSAATAQRRSRKDRIAAVISASGIALVAGGVLLNAFVPLRPHQFASLFVPASGIGAVLFLAGFALALIGIGFMPKGETGKWLTVRDKESEKAEPDTTVWPPAPRT